MSWVEVQGFSYTYPGEETPALLDVNLTIEQSEFVVIAGPSGSGKSSLGKALAGFLFQDEQPRYSGKIFVNQTDMSKIPLFLSSERVAYVQQNPEDQFCTLSVLDEIAFALENACLPANEIEHRIEEALAIVKGLELRERQLATLSGGEKQKVAIASMLALSPDVLILDEPTSNLDPVATQHIFETLHGLRNQTDLTVIIIEHKLSQLRAFDPQLFLMEEGKIISEMPIHEFSPGQLVDRVEKVAPQSGRSQDSSPLVDLSHICLRLGGKQILSDINLSVYPGEFVALMGPNGSGKSTLLQTIMGFHKPDQGTIMGFDRDLKGAKTSALVSDIGYIFQNPDHQLFTQSVWEEATLTLQNLDLLDDENASEAKEMMAEIGLADRLDDHPQRLSYGEKRRLNLAAAILHNPKLLLIDEFLIGQDIDNAHKWMRTLRNYADRGHTILLVNHHAVLTQVYCDRVIFLNEGKKILDAPVVSAFEKLVEAGFSAFTPQFQEGLAFA